MKLTHKERINGYCLEAKSGLYQYVQYRIQLDSHETAKRKVMGGYNSRKTVSSFVSHAISNYRDLLPMLKHCLRYELYDLYDAIEGDILHKNKKT